MSRNPYGSILFEISSLLSQQVSSKDKFFQEIALMDTQTKKAYALLYGIKETKLLDLDIDNMSDIEIIEEIIMPLLQRLGQAIFKSDVLTNLGFKVGRTTRALSWEDRDNTE